MLNGEDVFFTKSDARDEMSVAYGDGKFYNISDSDLISQYLHSENYAKVWCDDSRLYCIRKNSKYMYIKGMTSKNNKILSCVICFSMIKTVDIGINIEFSSYDNPVNILYELNKYAVLDYLKHLRRCGDSYSEKIMDVFKDKFTESDILYLETI